MIPDQYWKIGLHLLHNLLLYVSAHPVEVAGLLVSYFAFFIPIRQYLGQKNVEEKDKRFNTYHRLIKELVDPEGGGILDRQIAVVYELRNYPEYYEVTRRILTGLLIHWGGSSDNTRLINEINITIAFINQPRRWKYWYYKSMKYLGL